MFFMHATCLVCIIFLNLINVRSPLQILKILVMQFSPPFCYFICHRSKYYQNCVVEHPQSNILLRLSDTGDIFIEYHWSMITAKKFQLDMLGFIQQTVEYPCNHKLLSSLSCFMYMVVMLDFLRFCQHHVVLAVITHVWVTVTYFLVK